MVQQFFSDLLSDPQGMVFGAGHHVLDLALDHPFQTTVISGAALVLRRPLVELLLVRFGFFVYIPLHAVIGTTLLAGWLTNVLAQRWDIDGADTQTMIAAASLMLSPLTGWNTSGYILRNVSLRTRHRRQFRPQGIHTPGSLVTDFISGYVYGVLSIALPGTALIAGTLLGAALGGAWLGEIGTAFGGLIGACVGCSWMFALSNSIHHLFRPRQLYEELGRDDPGAEFQPLLSEPDQYPKGHGRGGR